MKYYLPFIFLLLISLQTACAQHDIARPWDQDVIYFALTDRFFDGDASNNRPPESDSALYDPTQSDMDLYHGAIFADSKSPWRMVILMRWASPLSGSRCPCATSGMPLLIQTMLPKNRLSWLLDAGLPRH